MARPPRLGLERERLAELLKAAAQTRILVVGDVMLDEYLVGDADRVSPEAPVPVVRVRERRFTVGGAANVADNVRAIGAACRLVGVVGGDTSGTQLRAMLKELGVNTDGLVHAARHTTRKTRVVARSQQLLRIDEEDDEDLPAAEVALLVAAIEAAMPHAQAVVLEDYNKGVLTPVIIARTIELARARSVPVVVDPKFRHFFAYRGATLFKPNRRELASALGAEVDLGHPEAILKAVERLGVDNLLLTLGEHGMLMVSRDQTLMSIPTVAREVYDVVGAGDTVTAFVAAILAAGGSPAEAAIIANFAAGVEVGKAGAATVSPDEVTAAYDELASTPGSQWSSVYDEAALTRKHRSSS